MTTRTRERAGLGAGNPGAPRGTGYTVVVLRVLGERNVCEKHIGDVPAAVNFLRVGRDYGPRAQSRRAFYLFISRLATTSSGNAAGGSSTGARWEPRPDIAYCSLEPLGDVAAFFFWTWKRKPRRAVRERDFSHSLTSDIHGYSCTLRCEAKHSYRNLSARPSSLPINDKIKFCLVNNFIYVRLHSKLFFVILRQRMIVM